MREEQFVITLVCIVVPLAFVVIGFVIGIATAHPMKRG